MGQQVLLIDDSQQIHSLVAGLLQNEPCHLHFASYGELGLTYADSIRPDLILLDVEMPGMDGYATCRLLKTDPNLFNIPVVFLTSHGTTEEKVHGLDLGATDYITKPFSPAELLARVRANLRISRAIKMLEESSRIDFLTGLGNRAMFKERLAAEVSLRTRTKKPLACVVVDINNFQAINDTQGHPFGDTVLQRVGEVLKSLARIEDVACRLGGDAFVIITPNTETEDANSLAQRISRDLQGLKFAHRDQTVEVECNIGVGPAIDMYDRAMYDRAAAAIREAKKIGLDGVVIAEYQTAEVN